MPKAQFLADPIAAINTAIVVPVGNTNTPYTRLQFNLPLLLSQTTANQTTIINQLSSTVSNSYLCATL